MCEILAGVLVSFLCLATNVRGDERVDVFTSAILLEKLFSFDKLVGEAISFIPKINDQAKRYLELYGKLVVDASRGGVSHESFAGHPLHVYSLMKRLISYYPHFNSSFETYVLRGDTCQNNNMSCEMWSRKGLCDKDPRFMMFNCPEVCGFCAISERMKKVKRAQETTVMPTIQDLKGSASGIGVLQKIYNLPIQDLVKGKIYNYFSSVELTEWDCMYIAQENAKWDRLLSAYIWFQKVMSTTKNQDMATYVSSEISEISRKHDITWVNDEDHFLMKLEEDPNQKPYLSRYSGNCLALLNQVTDYDMKCELTTRDNLFFLLQPVKQEMLSQDPQLYLFHDVISESEMDELKQISRGYLKRESERISEQAFLPRNSHPVVDTLNRRSSMLTGLLLDDQVLDGGDNKEAEPLKVRNYVPGGNLLVHTDTYQLPPEKAKLEQPFPNGNRIASLLYYLNDVEEGGRTAFFNFNVSLKPKRGSAVFWYNLFKNGTVDKRMDHGGCPVVFGTKWVAVKWFRERWNFHTRPCSTEKDE